MLSKNVQLYYRIVRFYTKPTEPIKAPESFWNHPAGPKTIFFWAPVSKWCLLIAGLKDYKRPPETVSVPQTVSLAISCLAMARFALIIIPVNYNLCICNISLALINLIKLWTVYTYRKTLKK